MKLIYAIILKLRITEILYLRGKGIIPHVINRGQCDIILSEFKLLEGTFDYFLQGFIDQYYFLILHINFIEMLYLETWVIKWSMD